jgi:glycosyltransferase involved in cell wall biosynthesis
VVATRVGGLVDAIEDGVTGRLVASQDSAALREVLIHLLASSPLRETLGTAARARARERDALGAVPQSILAAYVGESAQ